ncbi:MAG TPA: PHP domain-containing protein [Dehalococcoidales bacterium]
MSTLDYSHFKKLDLHIHTPHSLCYSDMTVKPDQIVEAAVATGLNAIGITDHNTVEGIDEIRKAASEEKLVVFPGIELTTRSGHFLAIFNVGTYVIELDRLLDELGIAAARRGDGVEQISGEAEAVFKMVVEYGGVVIAAHIERWPSGFLETKESRSAKMVIHASPFLSALEISVAQNCEQWNKGQMRGYPKKYACIQGSDAHAPDEVGRRPFLVRMEKVGLGALKSAFANWDNSIAFPD